MEPDRDCKIDVGFDYTATSITYVMDELTRDMENIKVTEITWHWHVDEYDYSFTTDIKLATGDTLSEITGQARSCWLSAKME